MRPNVVIGASNNTTAAFNAARANATQVGALRPTIVVGGSNATAAAFNAARSGAVQLGSLRPTITVAGNDATGPAFNAARAGAAQLGTMRPTITVTGDAAQWARVAEVSGMAAFTLGRLRPTITVSGNDATGAAFNAARAGAVQLGALRPTITVAGNDATGPAFNTARAGAVQLGAMRPTITVSGNAAQWATVAGASGNVANALARLRPTITVAGNNATGPAFSAAAAAATQLGSLRPIITVTGNDATGPAFNTARAAAVQLGAMRPTITVTGNAAQWAVVAGAAGNVANALGRLRPTITVVGNNATGPAFNAARAGAMQLGALRPTITVTGNNATGPAFNAARAGAVQLGAMSPTITVNGNAAQWATVAAASGNVASALGRLRPTITVTGNNNTAAAFGEAAAGANAVGRLRPTITVGSNNATGPGFAAAAAGAAAVGRLRPTITVDVDTTTATIKETAFAAYTTTLMGSMQGVLDVISGKWIILGAAVASLLPAITPLLGMVLSLGSAAAGLAGGLGLVAGAAYVLANSSFPTTEAAFTNLKNAWEGLRQSLLRNVGFNQAAVELAHIGDLAIGIAQNQIPMLGAAAKATMDEIRTSINSVIARMGSSMSDSFSTIVAAIPGIMGNITTAVGAVSAGLLSLLAQATPQAQQLAQWIADTATAFFQWADSAEGRQQVADVLAQAAPVAKALWQALVDIVPPLIDIGVNHGPEVVQTINDLSSGIASVVNAVSTVIGWLSTLDSWLNSIQTATEAAGTSVHNFLVNIPAEISSLIGSLATAGSNIIVGLINGMVDAWNNQVGRVQSIGSAILNTLKGALGIASPSRPAMEFGQNVGAALALGMLSQVAQIRMAANALGSAAIPSIVGGSIPIWRAGTTDATVLGGGPGPMAGVLASPLLAPSTGFAPYDGTPTQGTLEARLAALEALMAQQNALLANGIKLDGDTTGRIGNEAAGGLSNRLRNDMWTRQDMIAGQTKALESAKFGGLLQ